MVTYSPNQDYESRVNTLLSNIIESSKKVSAFSELQTVQDNANHQVQSMIYDK